ncbi:MAG: response regulator [Arcobacteraceae bacterium]
MSTSVSCDDISKFKFLASNYNILIVEDSKSMNKILYQSFSKKGFKCHSALTLQEAREILDTTRIDYILLDLHLPDGDGFEIINEREQSHEKIFVLTAESDKDFQESVYKKGIIDFIVKDSDFFYKINQIILSIESLEKNKQKTVLIVDDSLVIQAQLKNILENRNYKTALAADTQTAMQILNEKKIDLMLLDVELKESNGIEFLKKHKNDIVVKKNIPVMIVSGNVDASVIREGLKSGAVDVIKKPYVLEEIILKVDLWVDYRRKEDEVKCSTAILAEYKDAVDERSIVSKADSKGRITYVNKHFCTISGYTEDELLGKNHNIVRHPDMGSDVFKEIWHTIKELKKTWQGKVKNRKKDGSFYWVDALIRPIIDKDGEIVEFIALRSDITEIENYKEILKNQLSDTNHSLEENINYTAQYEEAINTFTAILKTDVNNNITYINEEFSKLSGYTQEELIGTNTAQLRHKNHRVVGDCANLAKKLSQNEHMSITFTNVAKDGSLYFVETIAYPITNIDGEVVEHLQLMHDITELRNLHKEIEETQKEIVYKMGEIGESRSKETGNHVKRVAEYSKNIALLYGLSAEDAEILFTASPMHDIGKVAIPDSILKKPGPLTDEEFEVMKTHAEIGFEILKGSTRKVLKAASIVSHEHHEKWDGRGYPRGLKGEEIHIFGRITAIADVFDALGSHRCYKKAWEDSEIYNLLQEQSGKQFDPKLVDIFLENKAIFTEIRDKYADS